MRPRRRILAHRIPCAQCDKTFSKTEHLNRHRLVQRALIDATDTGERPYKCSICSKQFSRRDVLLRHRRNHPSENGSRPDGLSLTPTYPSQELSPGEAHETGMDGREEILIPPAIEENALGIPTRLLSENNQLAAVKEAQGYGSLHDLARGNLSNEFLTMLFHPSYESQSPLNSLIHQPIIHPNHQDGFQSSQLHSVVSSGSLSRPDVAYQVATRMQSLWPGGSQGINRPSFWYGIAFGSSKNIYATYDSGLGLDPSNQTRIDDTTPEITLTDNCKRRLGGLKRNTLVCGCNQIFDDGFACELRYCCINTTEVFDQGFYLYTHKFQPAYPVLHLATFSPDNTPTLLIFIMCMVGISFLKTEEAVAFVQKAYPVWKISKLADVYLLTGIEQAIINEVYTRVISATVVSQTPVDILSDLVLAHHTLFLFISTGGNLCLEKSQILYIHTLTTAQKYGFFSSKIEEPINALSPPNMSENARCLIIGLLLHDSWLSELFSMNPIIQAHALAINLPQSNILYEAPNCHAWSQLSTNTSTKNDVLELSSHNFSLPDLNGPVHAFSMYGLLCSVLLRVSADTYRLVSSSDIVPASQHHHVPWRICQIDKRASIAAPLLTSLIQVYDETLRKSNPNCIIIWHSVCILLTVDANVLARAAGREGPEIMSQARLDLSSWINTTAARRACLHAAQAFRTLSHRKPADGTAFQSVRTLFMSALVLGMYILMGPDYLGSGQSNGSQFDLANTDLDWQAIGDEGLSDHISSPSAKSVEQEDPGINFIRDGGPIIINGKIYRRGSRHAQRIILEFASLLDEVGSHWMADYARLLYMIHDTMAEPTGAP
ncbi:hypothetical protein N7448_005179 [Penicillium atrosanguineum]|uniref:Uncharacterized protein n=1 Tax=Penicillium atrosanguineum TaxID=1132637 RepID=A0A9W9H339_9EURO|nr:uncharacterized protein N7443_008909 [Penicillium atrosanguineum]KAJ5125866.1 hypothetical protein N7526_008043 [Penicillium atrosanguineum]KAJ5136625.1 hypothetical protein N7448_005179 [Penicillium atrosanguineum]KAJ5292956.1 hypothetical protein N7443_008909 [Penicillium atrosanguineum]KAJ5303006.1 hypothetical protein N7476_009805 [Penicillium atrosanguineum]